MEDAPANQSLPSPRLGAKPMTRPFAFFDYILPRSGPSLHVASDTGSGPAVILIHGIASSSTTFAHLRPLLEDRYRTVSIDLMGFGHSPAPDNATFSLDEHADAVIRTLRKLRVKGPCVLVGHSLGALVVSRLAARHPRLVSRLVLISPPILVSPQLIGDPFDRRWMEFLLQMFINLRRDRKGTISQAAAVAWLLAVQDVLAIDDENWRAFELSLKNAIEHQTTVSDIAAISTSIDVIYGALDPFLVPSGLRLISRMQHVQTQRIEATHHHLGPRLSRAVAQVLR